jgi:hypothetical protein
MFDSFFYLFYLLKDQYASYYINARSGSRVDFERLASLSESAEGFVSTGYFLMLLHSSRIPEVIPPDLERVNRLAARVFALFHSASHLLTSHEEMICGYLHQYGLACDVNEKEALKYYRLSAHRGNVIAQCSLGWCLQHGIGSESNMKEAVGWYLLASDQGYSVAQCNLGWCYQHGQAVDINLKEATRLYQLSADRGYAVAQSNLGWCYQNGHGVIEIFP